MDGPGLHPDCEPLAFLLGTWAGEGEGWYPTVSDFAYGEETVFGHVGKPFLHYRQRTWALDNGRPLHAEMGFLRPSGGGTRAELVVAHPSGVAEVAEGLVDGSSLRLATTALASSGTAKSVTALERDIVVVDDRLSYVVRMAAVGQPLVDHLAAALVRSS
jgi:hypothetical protein